MKKIVVMVLIFLFLLPLDSKAVTLEEYNSAVAGVAISAATTYVSDFQYSFIWGGSPSNPVNMSSTLSNWLKSACQGIKIKSGKIYGTSRADAGIHGSFANSFPVYCATYVQLMVYHAANGKTTFNYGSNDSYEKISVNNLKRGDIIDFPSHIAIFLSDANDNDPDTFKVAEASGKNQVAVIRAKADNGWRIKSSVLKKLDYNVVTASYDFHNRLDDYAPIISSVEEIANTNRIRIVATDYKHYDLPEKSNVLEPESNGIVAYFVSKDSNTPTTGWKEVNKTTVLNIEEAVEGNGVYYIFVKDVGGNVTKKKVNLTKIYTDNELPTLGTFSYESMETSVKITITGATDNKEIKEYHYYLDGAMFANTKDNSYVINNLASNKTYKFQYEVVDSSNNVVKSQVYDIEAEMDAESIEVADEDLYIVKDDTYKIEPKVEINRENYKIKYKSNDESIAIVSSDGDIKGIAPGKATVTISVGRTKKEVNVTVSSQAIIFDLYDLPSSYVGKEYNLEIVTNPKSTVSIINSKLPDGLYLSNNILKGTPTENTIGEYPITFHAQYNNSEAIKKYTLYVKYNVEIENNGLNKAYLNKEYSELIKVNCPATISIINGELPTGLKILNNKVSGVPTEAGEFKFTVKADYKNSTCEREYTIVVSKYSIYDYLIIAAIIAGLLIIFILVRKNKHIRNNNNQEYEM